MTWSEAFAAYLKRHKIKASEAAKLLGVSPATIHNWTVQLKEPRGGSALEIRRKVEVWSRGEVPAAPWTAPPAKAPESGTDVDEAARAAS